MLHLDYPKMNSTCDVLNRASKLEKDFNEYENRDQVYKFALTTKVPLRFFWIHVRKMVVFSQIFKRKTKLVTDTSYVTTHLFFYGGSSNLENLSLRMIKILVQSNGRGNQGR